MRVGRLVIGQGSREIGHWRGLGDWSLARVGRLVIGEGWEISEHIFNNNLVAPKFSEYLSLYCVCTAQVTSG